MTERGPRRRGAPPSTKPRRERPRFLLLFYSRWCCCRGGWAATRALRSARGPRGTPRPGGGKGERGEERGLSLELLFLQSIDHSMSKHWKCSPASRLFNCSLFRSLSRTRNSTASRTSGAACHLAWRETDAAAEEVLEAEEEEDVIAADALSPVLSSSRSKSRSVAVAATAIAAAGDFDRHGVGRGGRGGAIARLSFPFPPAFRRTDESPKKKRETRS